MGATDGAGVADSYAGLVSSIKDEAAGEGSALGVAVVGAGTVVDTVVAVMDPLNALLTAGIGWLIEHLSFLRAPLDMLAGNPAQINAVVDGYKQAAATMHATADAHTAGMSTVRESWSGRAASAFHASMDQVSGELRSLGVAMDGTAAVIGITGSLVIMLRDLIRGWVASFVAGLIEPALVAAASAVVTCGGSIAAFVGATAARAAALAAKIADKIAELLAAFARQGSRLAQLGDMMDTITKGLGRFSMAGGTANQLYDATRPYSPDPGQGRYRARDMRAAS